MGTLDLEMMINNLQQIIELKVEEMSAGNLNAECILQLSMFHRQLACGFLLSRYSVGDFFSHLTDSANIYNYYLENMEKDPDPYYLSRSKGQPFIDALAANAFDLARDISSKMPNQVTENMEYEDDFIYFKFLGDCVAHPCNDGELKASAELFESVSEGVSPAKVELMEALVEKDSAKFDSSLQDIIADRIDHIAKHRMSKGADTIFSITDANIYIEGIALLRIARQMGLKARSAYQLIPAATLEDYGGDRGAWLSPFS